MIWFSGLLEYFKKDRIVKKNLILAAVLMILWNPNSFAYDTYKVPSESPLFQFYIYNKGESYKASEGMQTSTFTLDENQRQAIFNSAINWKNILNTTPLPASDKLPTFAVTTNNELNASAESSYFAIDGLDYKITAINAYINSKTISDLFKLVKEQNINMHMHTVQGASNTKPKRKR